ncbi:unnamed protein product, partial [Prorocentrum cordatum]
MWEGVSDAGQKYPSFSQVQMAKKTTKWCVVCEASKEEGEFSGRMWTGVGDAERKCHVCVVAKGMRRGLWKCIGCKQQESEEEFSSLLSGGPARKPKGTRLCNLRGPLRDAPESYDRGTFHAESSVARQTLHDLFGFDALCCGLNLRFASPRFSKPWLRVKVTSPNVREKVETPPQELFRRHARVTLAKYGPQCGRRTVGHGPGGTVPAHGRTRASSSRPLALAFNSVVFASEATAAAVADWAMKQTAEPTFILYDPDLLAESVTERNSTEEKYWLKEDLVAPRDEKVGVVLSRCGQVKDAVVTAQEASGPRIWWTIQTTLRGSTRNPEVALKFAVFSRWQAEREMQKDQPRQWGDAHWQRRALMAIHDKGVRFVLGLFDRSSEHHADSGLYHAGKHCPRVAENQFVTHQNGVVPFGECEVRVATYQERAAPPLSRWLTRQRTMPHWKKGDRKKDDWEKTAGRRTSISAICEPQAQRRSEAKAQWRSEATAQWRQGLQSRCGRLAPAVETRLCVSGGHCKMPIAVSKKDLRTIQVGSPGVPGQTETVAFARGTSVKAKAYEYNCENIATTQQKQAALEHLEMKVPQIIGGGPAVMWGAVVAAMWPPSRPAAAGATAGGEANLVDVMLQSERDAAVTANARGNAEVAAHSDDGDSDGGRPMHLGGDVDSHARGVLAELRDLGSVLVTIIGHISHVCMLGADVAPGRPHLPFSAFHQHRSLRLERLESDAASDDSRGVPPGLAAAPGSASVTACWACGAGGPSARQAFSCLVAAAGLFGFCHASDASAVSSLSFDVAAAKNRPVSKVITLLKDMLKQLEKEAEEDEEIYDKMACWCETNDKEKTKAISDAEARISALE